MAVDETANQEMLICAQSDEFEQNTGIPSCHQNIEHDRACYYKTGLAEGLASRPSVAR